MNTLYLKYAVEVERSGSITRAAENLYMNQPHLSKTIRELEETLGTPIFRRTSKGMLPTKAGAEFLAYAKNILAQVEMIENLANGDRSSKIEFSVTVPRASYISYAFTEYVKTLPSDRTLTIDYRESNSAHAIENVVEEESNLGIIRFPARYEGYFMDFLQEKGLDFEILSRFKHLILMSKEHPLAKREPIVPLRLEDYIEITHGDSGTPSPAKPQKSPDAESGRREIAIYERGSQFELLGRIPSTYMWASPVPEEVLSTFGLVQRRCDSPRRDHHKDLLIYRSGYRFTDEDEAFISKLKKVVQEIPFFDLDSKGTVPRGAAPDAAAGSTEAGAACAEAARGHCGPGRSGVPVVRA
ncbi:MAG: LysR family transcriptional regulator [Synergistaceae bacterium]|nr:LysR family transcriptional regulator [Synergistaceae bacterium]